MDEFIQEYGGAIVILVLGSGIITVLSTIYQNVLTIM